MGDSSEQSTFSQRQRHLILNRTNVDH
jgi:hypothetical protein